MSFFRGSIKYWVGQKNSFEFLCNILYLWLNQHIMGLNIWLKQIGKHELDTKKAETRNNLLHWKGEKTIKWRL